jgi:hypothetical protein
MRKLLTTALFLSALFFLQGCVKDNCDQTLTYTFFRPVYKTKTEVRTNIRSNAPRQVERPGKLYIRGNYIFLTEIDRGIHVIDNANPANPQNVAFIDIPGNMDMAVKGNILYADLYTDLVALDITNPSGVKLEHVEEGVFPHRRWAGNFWADTSKVIADWIRVDTTVKVDCSSRGRIVMEDRAVLTSYTASGTGGASAAASPFGMGGSMARFAIVNEYLYTVGPYDLSAFNITTGTRPQFVSNRHVGMNIETIYPFKNNLFLGSTSGMFIYNISSPGNPTLTGQFSHVRSCDPVIADDTHAYVTLRSGTTCQGFTNQMEVLKLNNLTNPSLVKTYQLTNPHGLSKDGNTLFICDGRDGLKVYNAANVENLQLLNTISGIETYDVIAFNKVAIVVAKDGLYQYDYSDLSNIRLLSKITVNR